MNAVAEKQNQGRAVAELPFAAPDVNIYETQSSFVLQAEMPGVAKEGLDVQIEGGTLVFVGRRADTAVTGRALHRESPAANFRRVFELDPSIDTGRIVALASPPHTATRR